MPKPKPSMLSLPRRSLQQADAAGAVAPVIAAAVPPAPPSVPDTREPAACAAPEPHPGVASDDGTRPAPRSPSPASSADMDGCPTPDSVLRRHTKAPHAPKSDVIKAKMAQSAEVQLEEAEAQGLLAAARDDAHHAEGVGEASGCDSAANKILSGIASAAGGVSAVQYSQLSACRPRPRGAHAEGVAATGRPPLPPGGAAAARASARLRERAARGVARRGLRKGPGVIGGVKKKQSRGAAAPLAPQMTLQGVLNSQLGLGGLARALEKRALWLALAEQREMSRAMRVLGLSGDSAKSA